MDTNQLCQKQCRSPGNRGDLGYHSQNLLGLTFYKGKVKRMTKGAMVPGSSTSTAVKTWATPRGTMHTAWGPAGPLGAEQPTNQHRSGLHGKHSSLAPVRYKDDGCFSPAATGFNAVPDAQNELELSRIARPQTFSSSILFFCFYLLGSIF